MEGRTASGPVVEAVRKHLGIFLTTPDRREGFERISLKGDRLEIWFMRPVSNASRDKATCEGLRWLLMGRMEAALGVRQLLQTLRMVNEISLIFYDVETQVKPDRQGDYKQTRSPVPHARFTISRERAALLDSTKLGAMLRGRSCAQVGQGLLDNLWVRR